MSDRPERALELNLGKACQSVTIYFEKAVLFFQGVRDLLIENRPGIVIQTNIDHGCPHCEIIAGRHKICPLPKI